QLHLQQHQIAGDGGGGELLQRHVQHAAGRAVVLVIVDQQARLGGDGGVDACRRRGVDDQHGTCPWRRVWGKPAPVVAPAVAGTRAPATAARIRSVQRWTSSTSRAPCCICSISSGGWRLSKKRAMR